MDFRHGHGNNDDSDRRAPAPAHGNLAHVSHESGGHGNNDDRRAPAPAHGNVAHVSHESGGHGNNDDRRAPAPAHGNIAHVSHESGGHDTRPHQGGGGSAAAPAVANQQAYRILCKAGEDSFSLAARGGKVCFIRTNQNDDAQHWIKDTKYSTKVKDEEGYPAISLVNKATGEALKHSLGQDHPVLLTHYTGNSMDESVLWTESRDVGNGYRCIRMVNNIYLNFDALNGDPNQGGGVRDGTTLTLWEWTEGDNQRWKIVEW